MAIRSTRPTTTSVVIHNVEEEPRRATPLPTVQSQDKGKCKMVEPEPTSKNPIKAQIQRDEKIAQRLFEEEQGQFEKEQRIARKKAAEQEADADVLLAERLQQKEREQFTIDEQARMLVDLIAERKREQKWINDFVLIDYEVVNDSEQQAESSKKRSRAIRDK
nr:hypothetical protein [Tanacetum cinerariifolium]